MKSYTLKKVHCTPNWDTIPSLAIDIPYEENCSDIRAHAQLCWDDTGIHVHLQAVESDIRAEHTGLLDMVCEDSCLEFFLRPTEAMSYFNIEFNLNCALYLGFGTNRYNCVRLVTQDNQQLFHPRANRTADGWEVTYYIPFSFIRQFFPSFVPKKGLRFYGNFYKCASMKTPPHHFSWMPAITPIINFHCPEHFGQLILGGKEL